MRQNIIILVGLGVIIAALLGILLFVPAPKQTARQNNQRPITAEKTIMNIQSPNFQNNQSIPEKYTCDGENVNPELQISGVPQNAKSLALIMHDPDAPRAGGFTHWLIWNIPPATSLIAENSVPSDAVEGMNDAGKTAYIGPCPPSGTHRYFFKLYALGAMLDLKSGAGKNELETEINKYLLDKAELIGLYQR